MTTWSLFSFWMICAAACDGEGQPAGNAHADYANYVNRGTPHQTDLPYEAFVARRVASQSESINLLEFSFPLKVSGARLSVELNGVNFSPTYGGLRFFGTPYPPSANDLQWNYYVAYAGQEASGFIHLESEASIPFAITRADYSQDGECWIELNLKPRERADESVRWEVTVSPAWRGKSMQP